MIILTGVVPAFTQAATMELPYPDMIIDPRPCMIIHPFPCCRICSSESLSNSDDIGNGNDTTVTIASSAIPFATIDIWYNFRIYDPAKEAVPDFHSTTYVYMGVDGERAPWGTEVLIIHRNVRSIKKKAFSWCTNMKKCLMHDEVHTIEDGAFEHCYNMKVIRLSRNLEWIGQGCFEHCVSLVTLVLPPSLTGIGAVAFLGCRNLRILPLHANMNTLQIGFRYLCGDIIGILYGCDIFFQTIQVPGYNLEYNELNVYNVHQSIIDFYHHNLPPLHKACLDTSVNAQKIIHTIASCGKEATSIRDHNGMTPLHILAMNPHADEGAILACFYANIHATFVEDDMYNCALDYVREYQEMDELTALISALCVHRETR